MAKKWEDHAGAYKKLMSEASKYSQKAVKPLIADFINSYRKIENFEGKLPDALIKARENGVTADGLAAFKKDKVFADAYKALDKEVDVLWALQVKIKNSENEALSAANDLKNLSDRIEKDMREHEKDQKDAEAKAKKNPPPMKEQLQQEIQKRDDAKKVKELQLVLASIVKDRKDLTEAGNLFDKQTDKKMTTYAAKFDKMIEKILDMAPEGKDDGKGGNDPDLPGKLQFKPFSVTVKKAVLQGKTIEKHCTMAVEKAKKDKKQSEPELKAASSGVKSLKELQISLGRERKKAEQALRKSDKAKEYQKMFEQIEESFQHSFKALRTAVTAIAKLP